MNAFHHFGRGLALAGVAMSSVPAVLAQSVVVAPGSDARAQLASNGATVIDIVAANASGLSYNRYESFNADAPGVVLNNATVAALSPPSAPTSQLAGDIAPNTGLASAASVILNEVSGNSRSVLAGPIEVHGSRADVVLANPAGITCAGCGFINTDRVTLTTGAPKLKDGALDGFDVTGGDILIDGKGVDASHASQVLALAARAVRLDGNAVARQELTIAAGAHHVSYANGEVMKISPASAETPRYAIDSTALGGMYANRIRLDATEEGVGVRMRGRVWALGEDLTLTSAGAVDLGGEVSALRDAVISSETQVRSDGQVNAMRQAELRAPDIVIGRERSGIRAGNISLQATALETGPLTAGSAPTGNIDNHGEIRASGSVSIAARGSVTNRGTIAGRQSIALDAQTLVNHGAIVSEGSATIAAATLRNEVPGGDTRVWEASSPRHTTKVGPAQEQRIPFLRITTQDFEETWRRTQRYAGPTPTHGPLISAGTQLSLNFYKGSNLGGRLHAGDILSMRGDSGYGSPDAGGNRGGNPAIAPGGNGAKEGNGANGDIGTVATPAATFRHDDLALVTRTHSARFRMTRRTPAFWLAEWLGLARATRAPLGDESYTEQRNNVLNAGITAQHLTTAGFDAASIEQVVQPLAAP